MKLKNLMFFREIDVVEAFEVAMNTEMKNVNTKKLLLDHTTVIGRFFP